MGIELIVTAIGVSGAAAGLMGILSYWVEQRRKKRAPTLEDRITTLAKSLESSAAVISEIENEVSKRREIAQKLREDVQRYEQLRELSQPQVEAVAQTLRSQIAAESRRSIFIQAGIAFVFALVFFLLGLWVGGI